MLLVAKSSIINTQNAPQPGEGVDVDIALIRNLTQRTVGDQRNDTADTVKSVIPPASETIKSQAVETQLTQSLLNTLGSNSESATPTPTLIGVFDTASIRVVVIREKNGYKIVTDPLTEFASKVFKMGAAGLSLSIRLHDSTMGGMNVEFSNITKGISEVIHLRTRMNQQSLDNAVYGLGLRIGLEHSQSVAMFQKNNTNNEIQEWIECTTPEGYIGYPHDGVCSAIARDGRIRFWWPCAGTFEFDVLDCCQEHDKRLYCITSIAEFIDAQTAFAACVIYKMWRAGMEEMANGTWLQQGCAWLGGAQSFTIFSIGLFGLGVAALPVLGIHVLYNNWQYYNYDGSHNVSCLCGGDVPTLRCDCRDPTNRACYVCGANFENNCCVDNVTGKVLKRIDDWPCQFGQLPFCWHTVRKRPSRE